MKNRYYISNVINSDLWCIGDFRTNKVIYRGELKDCKSIIEDLNLKAKNNIDLEKYLKGGTEHGDKE